MPTSLCSPIPLSLSLYPDHHSFMFSHIKEEQFHIGFLYYYCLAASNATSAHPISTSVAFQMQSLHVNQHCPACYAAPIYTRKTVVNAKSAAFYLWKSRNDATSSGRKEWPRLQNRLYSVKQFCCFGQDIPVQSRSWVSHCYQINNNLYKNASLAIKNKTTTFRFCYFKRTKYFLKCIQGLFRRSSQWT